jgi:hypothetical protein
MGATMAHFRPRRRKYSSDTDIHVRSTDDLAEDDVSRHVFLGEGNEPLTEDLIKELVQKGWPEADLREFARGGAEYCRPRKSIVYPPEFGGLDENLQEE